MAQVVEHPTPSFGSNRDLSVMRRSPSSGSVLRVLSVESASVSFSLSYFPCSLSFFPSLK